MSKVGSTTGSHRLHEPFACTFVAMDTWVITAVHHVSNAIVSIVLYMIKQLHLELMTHKLSDQKYQKKDNFQDYFHWAFKVFGYLIHNTK